jgi:hypothetical protein
MEGFMRLSSKFKNISLILICLLGGSGCAGIMVDQGIQGDDLSSISLGTHREGVEDVLGSPDKICPARTSNDEQIIYYYFDMGIRPDPDGGGTIATADILTFGLSELIFFPIAVMHFGVGGPNGLMKVTYDSNDVMVNSKKYSPRQLSASYGPMGFKPGIMDCEEDLPSVEKEKVEDEFDSVPMFY